VQPKIAHGDEFSIIYKLFAEVKNNERLEKILYGSIPDQAFLISKVNVSKESLFYLSAKHDIVFTIFVI